MPLLLLLLLLQKLLLLLSLTLPVRNIQGCPAGILCRKRWRLLLPFEAPAVQSRLLLHST
jgi:hypothetical protein